MIRTETAQPMTTIARMAALVSLALVAAALLIGALVTVAGPVAGVAFVGFFACGVIAAGTPARSREP